MTTLERIFNNAGYAIKHKWVLTSAGKQRADLEILNIQVAQKIPLTNRQLITMRSLAMTPKKKNFHRRGVFFHNNHCTLGMTYTQAVSLRVAAPPLQHIASSLHLTTNSTSPLLPTSLTGTSATLVTSDR